MTESEKKERVKEQNRKAVKKYRKKTVGFAINYSAVDAQEGKRLKAYLDYTGQSANAFIKKIVKKELDSLRWMTETEQIDQEQITDIDDTTGTD